jgi:hypothetical protein
VSALGLGAVGVSAGAHARARTARAPRRRVRLEPAVLLLAVAVGAAAAVSPGACGIAIATAAVVALVWVRPAVGAYLLIGLTPLVAGIDRDVLVPLLRPNEALEALVVATVLGRWLVRLRAGSVHLARPGRLTVAILLLAVCGSVLPLAVMAVRGREVTSEDLMHAVVLWRLAGVYLVLRAAVTRQEQVLTCLRVSLLAASVVAAVGILQVLNLFGVRDLLAATYAPFGDTAAVTSIARAGSTLALPAATADLVIFNLAVAVALWHRRPRSLPVLGPVAAILVVGALAAGEFSSTLGLLVGVVALVLVTGRRVLLAPFAVLGLVGALAVRPVIEERLRGFQLGSSLPESWVGRLYNLRTYFWPELLTDGNYLVGVRPAARVAVDLHATGFVWIESGYTWLLWGGGLPLLGAYAFFTWVAAAHGWRVARADPGPTGAAATGLFVGVVVVVVLMVFDPHVTYRGAADALFGLAALACVAPRTGGTDPPDGQRRGAAPEREPATAGARGTPPPTEDHEDQPGGSP